MSLPTARGTFCVLLEVPQPFVLKICSKLFLDKVFYLFSHASTNQNNVRFIFLAITPAGHDREFTWSTSSSCNIAIIQLCITGLPFQPGTNQRGLAWGESSRHTAHYLGAGLAPDRHGGSVQVISQFPSIFVVFVTLGILSWICYEADFDCRTTMPGIPVKLGDLSFMRFS